MKKFFIRFCTRIGCTFLLCFFSLIMQAQNYDRLWKEVETLQQRDLPKSVIQRVNCIYEKARDEKNVPQLMKAYFTRAAEQVKLTPDSAEVELERIQKWAKNETDPLTAAVLYHLLGNLSMQKDQPDWNEAMGAYRRALKEKDLLLKTEAVNYAPMTVTTSFSKTFFQDNLYDLLVRQTISGLTSNWRWRKNMEVQHLIIDLYDSLIDCYVEDRTAALLSHEAKILFLNEQGVADMYRLSTADAEKALKDLLRQYEKQGGGSSLKAAVSDDALVDVHLKLADKLAEQHQLSEAMEVLQTASSKYPRSSLNDALKSKIKWIQMPSLVMEVPVIYPSYQGHLIVNYKNITEVKIETYRLRLTPVSPELNGNLSKEILCQQYGKKVDTKFFRLPATSDYLPRIEKLSYQLPEAGIYMLKAIPIGKKGKADYQLMYVTPHQCLVVPIANGQLELIAIDCLSGNPVPDAEVVEYQREGYTNQFTLSKVWKTNHKGSVVLKNSQRGSFFVNVRTPGKDFMKICPVYTRWNAQTSLNQEWRQQTTLFTDRALYRPGQMVHVSGIRYAQLGDSLRTLGNKQMKVEFLDANGKKVGEESAVSDSFGVFAVDFTLPQHVLPGHFTIRTEHKVVGIRVENYKRPTFDVTFTPIGHSYTFGDVLSVNGQAQAFVGVPIRLAKGSYRVVRSEAWLWRSGGAESQIASGAFTTDAEGKFKIDLSLLPPPNVQNNSVPFYNYKVTAVITDGAGETQEGVYTIPVGKQSIGLNILGLKAKMPREKREKIQIQAMNLSRQLVKTEVSYQVFECGSADLSTQKIASGQSSDSKQDSVGKLVLEGKAMTQQSFVPAELYALPTGRYLLKVNAHDEQGRLVTASQEFVLFSLVDKCPPIETVQWFYQDGDNWENGKTVSLYVGSSEKNVYVLMDVYTANKRIRSERIYLNNNIHRFDFNYDESYGDGIVVSFAFMREGKLYSKQVRLERPKPQKQLVLKWESFRDQLTPGQQEVWRMKITDCSGNLVNANLLAAMYDASLDKLQKHRWDFQPYLGRRMPYVGVNTVSHSSRTMFYIDFPALQNPQGYNLLNPDTYSRLVPFSIWGQYNYIYPTNRVYNTPMFAMKAAGAINRTVISDEGFEVNREETALNVVEIQEEITPLKDESLQSPLRTNFTETAFFYPMLRTDSTGEVTISFTLPDALTEWNFIGFAHTQGMDFGKLTSKVKASKPFMVQPNLPRFVRVGDKSSLAASLINLSMETVEGIIRMELVNPMTDQVVFSQKQKFNVAEGETEVSKFNFQVSEDYDVLICRVLAEAGEFSDGEQHYLPVFTNKEWVTETMPFQLDGNETIDLSLDGLFNKQSRSATDKRLTIELVASPNWYVIQALPVVGNPINEDAISWATAYYANALAVQMVKNYPHIQQVFDTWLAEGATKETFWSKLEQNADLKNLLLEETPWLAEAQTEAEQKHRVALLFELNGMRQRLQLAARKLNGLQTAEGGWTWYKGMPVSRYTTIQIVELMARLKWMGVMLEPAINETYRKGLAYLKKEVAAEYKRMQEGDRKLFPSEQVVHYLYICAIDPQAQRMADKKINAYLIDCLLKGNGKTSIYNKSFSIYQKALMSIIMQANGQSEVAASLLQSVKEYLVFTPEMGAYFDTHKAIYSWNSYRIPTQVAAMEAIQRISPDTQMLNEMKQWLLKQKQVQVWNTPLATVDAIYAFLLNDKKALRTAGTMRAAIGKQTVATPNDALGYTKKSFTGNEVTVQTVSVQKEGDGIGWGAVYAQCFEQMDEVKSNQTRGLTIEREYLFNGKPINAHTILHTGDQLTVRLFIKVDRDMDFVRIKDARAACMEPAEQISGYQWKNGLSVYRVNRDASTEYYIDKLRKDRYVLEYNVYINRSGEYQSGSATIQSVYAPEFTSHTSGQYIKVE